MGSSASSSSFCAGDDRNPKPGDLIEIFRGGYKHWAIYVGDDGCVVHFVNDGRVLKEKLWDVVGSDNWKVNNQLDTQYEPRPINVIVQDANAMVGKILQYKLASKNCEHFVTVLRYGKSMSKQVKVAAAAGGTAVGTAVGTLAVIGCVLTAISR